MKASDIAARLTSEMPKYTDLLSDVNTISSIVSSGGTLTVTTSAAHSLTVGKPVSINGVSVPISITTLSRVLEVGTLVTSVDHDLTSAIASTITISDAADANFNGEFTLIQVVNRRTIKFTIEDSGATSTTGANLISAARFDQSYNGLYQVVTTPSTTIFTVSAPNSIAGSASEGSAKSNIRISATASLERAIAAYTQQKTNKAWLFAVLGETRASKDRTTNTDLTTNMTRSNFFRQQLIDNLSIFVISNTKDEIAGRKIRDEMEDLFVAISKSIVFRQFPAALQVGSSEPLAFINSDITSYDGALYIHEFNFEATTEFSFEDTSGYDDDVAFRDIDATYDSNLGTGAENANDLMNLDDEAL